MKSKVIIIVISSLLLLSIVVWGVVKLTNHAHDPETCTEHDHSHDNCTDHVHETPNQETFKVEADTVRNQPPAHSHNGQPHTH